jgi:Delta3-Delta2-enoyl-CoA isomerase
MKGLVKRGLYEKNDPDAVNLRESYGYVEYSFFWNSYYYSNTFPKNFLLYIYIAQAERFASGVPGKQFARIAKKEIKHKL